VLKATASDASPDLPTSVGWRLSGRESFMFNGMLDEVRLTAAALGPGQFHLALLKDLGGGLAAGNGVPQADGTGDLVGGNLFLIHLDKANPNHPAWLVTGLNRIDAPFKGGIMIPDADFVLALAANASGSVELSTAWPAGLPAGIELYFQWWTSDPAGPKGFGASNGLKGVTP
jgi:hypothetical protein